MKWTIRAMWLAGWLAGSLGVMAGPAEVTRDPLAGLDWNSSASPVSVNAREMNFDLKTQVMTLAGEAVIQRENVSLQADFIEWRKQDQIAHAQSNVVFRRGNMVWRGHEITYNFSNQFWKTGAFSAFIDPYYVVASGAERISETEYLLRDAQLSTCTNAACHEHYVIQARDVSVKPGDRLLARDATFYLGAVPIFHSPVWRRILDDRYAGLSLRPGYASSMGVFLLSAYTWPVAPGLKTTSHIDLRSSRGVAAGQDLDWRTASGGEGGAEFYFANDQQAEEDYPDEYEDGDVDDNRYRVRVHHQQPLSPEDYFLAELNYVADPYFLEDFFEGEYRRSGEPENYLNLVHSDEFMTAGLLTRFRLNDFYTVVERLPEATLDFSRREIPDTDFYFESFNSASFLNKAWEDDSTEDDFSVFRMDSQDTIYYPGRYFGFLSVVPRAGARGTFYSQTIETRELSDVTANVDSNGVLTSTTNITWLTEDQGAGVRGMMELGLETSFKAFQTWDTEPSPLIDGLRHIVEPYLNYTYIPDPNIEPDELYQFDDVDALDRQNTIALGVRNKLQTRRDRRPWDLIDLDLNTVYNLDPDEGNDNLESINMWLELTPVDFFKLNADGSYDTQNSQLETFNTRLWYIEEMWRLGLEHRYRVDSNDLISTMVNWLPNPRWMVEAYWRYEAQESQLEEQGYVVQRNLDCLSFRMGFRHLPAYTREDGEERQEDFRVEFAIWVNAFPDTLLGNSQRHKVVMP
jgi:LPS-assembly protein